MHFFSCNKRFLCVYAFLFIFFALAAQEPPVATDESRISLTTPIATTNDNSLEESPFSGIGALVRVVVVLALVCIAIYGIVYLIKKSTRINASNDPYLKNLALLPLGPSKSIQIIAAGSQAFVVGVTDHSISLITELSDKELIDAMILTADKTMGPGQGSFASILSKFVPGLLPQHKQNTESSMEKNVNTPIQDSLSASDTAEFLRSQRERLRNSGEGNRT